jgi:lipoprotein-anchoring transpeptidase ErfK/SrfK
MADSRNVRVPTRLLAAVVAISALAALILLGGLLVVLLMQPSMGSTLASEAELLIAELPESVAAVISTPVAVEEDQPTVWPAASATPTPNPLSAKPIVASVAFNRPKWTATPIPTQTPTPSPTPNPTFVSSAYGLGDYMPDGITRDERWIDVDLSEQKLVAYEGYVPVFDSLVSTGTALHPTVTGQFRIWLRFQAQDMNGYRLGYDYYLRNVPFVQYFYQDYALHGTFWHSNFGTPMSHGCVNLSPAASEWLYNWAGYGTLVNIHP